MQTLRLRIAVWYALLLVIAMIAFGIAVNFRLAAILRAQADAHVNATVQDIARSVAPEPGTFSLTPDALLTLENPDNLERWASITMFIEIDNVRGYPLAKSSNMGSITSFGATGITPSETETLREVSAGGRTFLVQSALLEDAGSAVIVQAGEPLDSLNQAFHAAQTSLALIIIIAAAAVAILSFVLASEVTTPLNQLAEAMRETGPEKLHRRLQWRGRRDEVGGLARAFDDLLARLEEAFARERRFISDASHELKTPLTSIHANAQMLARWGDKDAEIRKESLETIIGETASLASMVNGMLTLAKADSGDALPKEPVALSHAAREAVNATQGRAAEKGLDLQLVTPADSPIVNGDPALIRQLITNLVDNAIKFTPQGNVTVSISQDGGSAIAEVADTGPGIDEDELPMIFDRFYRADKSRSRTVPGTGLGLAIVRSIARVHGASVQALPRPGGGTILRVSFPCIH